MESSIVLEGCEIKTFSPRAPRTNLDGDELESPKMVITFVVDLDRVVNHMNRIARVFRKSRAVTLTLDFIEQLELPKLEPASDNDKRARAGDALSAIPSNGHSAQAKDAVEQTTTVAKGKGTKKHATP